MKKSFCFLLVFALVGTAHADIHFPPSADQGPTRKLGRAISNLAFGVTELPYSITNMNRAEGNAAAAGYGTVRGVGRTLNRWRFGVQELLTFPIPTNKGKYSAPYRSSDIWLNGGYQEFPPELGFMTSRPYARGNRQ